MTPRAQNTAADSGFWRLEHSHLAALLACPDLSWETARVYLALADLTLGYGKSKDIVSLEQIGKLAHTDHRHTCRALKRLAQLGLYGESKTSARKILRWIVWPELKKQSQEVSDSAKAGTNSNTTDSARAGTKDSAKAGTHQEKDIKNKTTPAPKVAGDFAAEPRKPSGRRQKSSAEEPRTKQTRSPKINHWRIWLRVWRQERPSQPAPLAIGPDTSAGKKLAKLVRDENELADIFHRFLQDQDQFLLKQGHALRLLPGRVNAYRGTTPDPDEQGEDFWERREDELEKSGDADDCRKFLRQHASSKVQS